MTERVDFYVLKSSTPKQRWTFACRLTEKAYLRDLTIVLLGDTLAEVEAIDGLLWTFSERSFVPHDIHRGRPSGVPTPAAATTSAAASASAVSAAAAVQLTEDLDSVGSADLLVNVSSRLPAGLDRFARVAEIIDTDDERRRLGRERFRAYRDMKLAVETHQLDDAAGA